MRFSPYLTCWFRSEAKRAVTRGHVDQLLATRGLRRRVRTVVPHFLAVAGILRASVGVATLPRRLAESFAGDGLVVVDPPMSLPAFSLTVVHDARRGGDPETVWLRQTLRETVTS